ncbi:MAG: glycosyl transferase family protein [Sphingopyxis granuli]|uniref:glycosyl transferase family protein n=1 Tax=Sphingopyxis granuli TaxID=267128 RepID=UPI003C752971
MDQAAAWIEWLVQGIRHELMLFAAVGILVMGLDDLLFDGLWFGVRRSIARRAASRPVGPRLHGVFAVFVPAWDEADVLPHTLIHALRAWDGEAVRLYVGCYPNDAATLFAASPFAARDPRVRLVIGDADGPTTKGDNLNRLWDALCEDERREGLRFAAVVLHDAEDRVHPAEIALYRDWLPDHAMIQIPVVPTKGADATWVSGHYGDEFAEAHGKELGVRSHLGLPLPAAGVGCAFARDALSLLALHRGGAPFRADSLTEDYEVGMLIGHYGLSAAFVEAWRAPGDPVVSRGAFPVTLEAAARQKARWVAGISLAGWDHLGWPPLAGGNGGRRRAWLARWMLWRDRRAPLAALILLAAYAGMVVTGIVWAGEALLGWTPPPIGDGFRLLLAVDAALLLWRLGMRGHFAARWYGMREAMLSIPRAFVANIVAMLAARRAVLLYGRMLRSREVVWDKTRHSEAPPPSQPDPLADPLAIPVRIA